jgi:hypothetical protein
MADLNKGTGMIKGLQCVMAVGLLCMPTAALALEFSADAVFHGGRGASGTNKVYVSNGKIRVQPVGDPAYEIFDEAKTIDYIIVPAKKLIIAEGPVTGRMRVVRYSVGPDLCAKVTTATSPATCTKLGLDKVNGRIVEKWQFSRIVRGYHRTNITWIDRSLNAVVKVLKDGRVSYELLNVHLGPQPASLFVIPAGLQLKQNPDPK